SAKCTEQSCPVEHTGKQLILETKAFAQENRLRSWWEFLSGLMLFSLCTACTFLPVHWVFKLAISLVSGLLMVRIFVIYHDHQHNAILDRSRLADMLMQCVGLLSLAPSSIWKKSHNHHHCHNSKLLSAHIGSYPIMTRERYKRADTRERLTYLFMRHPLIIACGYLTTFIFGMCLLPFLRSPREHSDGLLALVLHFSIAASLVYFGGISALLFALVIPMTLATALGSYLFYAQHNFPTVVHTDNGDWTYHGAALQASSYMCMPKLMHWFTANIGYHHVHHLNAKIPFYRLPEAMRAMPELQKPKTTSLHPAEILSCLRLKVWDVQQGCMVPLST
ncbi:MAG: fatty acid desaturase, partial [Verrucomicrobiota bacterium]